jgi:5-methylthioadenosine/S-adenosylhomocysteine deaminase
MGILFKVFQAQSINRILPPVPVKLQLPLLHPADLLIHNALVLTLEPGAAPIPHGYVAVLGGKILAVEELAPGQPLPPAKEYLDAAGALVMPGLVNTHCHAPMVWFRGLADDLALNEWLTRVIFPAEAGWLTPQRAYWGALLAAAELILGGVTCVADGYFYEAEVRRAGLAGRHRPGGGGLSGSRRA